MAAALPSSVMVYTYNEWISHWGRRESLKGRGDCLLWMWDGFTYHEHEHPPTQASSDPPVDEFPASYSALVVGELDQPADRD